MPNRNSRQPSLGRVYELMPELRPINYSSVPPVVTHADGSTRWANPEEARVLNAHGPSALNYRPPDQEFHSSASPARQVLTPRQTWHSNQHHTESLGQYAGQQQSQYVSEQRSHYAGQHQGQYARQHQAQSPAHFPAQYPAQYPAHAQNHEHSPMQTRYGNQYYDPPSLPTAAPVVSPGSHPKFFGEFSWIASLAASLPAQRPPPKKGLMSRLGNKLARRLDDAESVSGDCHICRCLAPQGSSMEDSVTFAISERELFSSDPAIGASESCIYCALLGEIVTSHQERGTLCNMIDVSVARYKPIVLRFFAPQFTAVGHLQPNDERAIAFVHKIADPERPMTPHEHEYESGSSSDITVARLPMLGHAQDFDQQLGSDYCFDFLRSSLEECVTKRSTSHAACWRGHDPTSLPTRVLDLANDQIRLVTRPQEGNYCILSYSWGTSGTNFTTTSTTLSQRQTGIQWHDLPAVHRDAISLTRRFGVRYLWIDSLCIIQYDPHGANDAADFSQEGQKMGQYYGNAYITIVAADCEDPSIPFLRPRDPTSFYTADRRAFTLGKWSRSRLVCRSFPPAGEAQGVAMTNGTKLASRGWTYQENILSKRLVHLTASEVMWECVTCQRFEFGVELTSPVGLAHRFELARSSDKPDKYDQFWRLFVTAYSDRQLTREKDRLVAMYGVAERLHRESELTPGDFLYGLWGAYLASHMLWRAKTATGSRSEYGIGYDKLAWGIPSWSWMSTTASVEYEATNRQARIESMVDAWSLGPTTTPSMDLQELDHRLAVRGYIGWAKLLAYQRTRSTHSPTFAIDFTSDRAANHLGCVSMTPDTHIAPTALPQDSAQRAGTAYNSARRVGGVMYEHDNKEIFETEEHTQEPFEAWIVVLWMASYRCRFTLEVEEALMMRSSYQTNSGSQEETGYYALVLSLAEEGGHTYRRLGFIQTRKLPDFAGTEKAQIELV